MLSKNVYEMKILNGRFRIDCRQRSINPVDTPEDRPQSGLFSIAVVAYLLQSQKIEPAAEWVSPLDLPGGSQFFRVSHTPPVNRIVSRFGESETDFSQACLSCDGEPIPFADIAYSFRVFPRIPMAVLLWLADDEFPARASILVDKTAYLHLPLDALFASMFILENAILEKKP